MGSRRRARTERMKCCIFELIWIDRRRDEVLDMPEGMEIGELRRNCKERECIDGQKRVDWIFCRWTECRTSGEEFDR